MDQPIRLSLEGVGLDRLRPYKFCCWSVELVGCPACGGHDGRTQWEGQVSIQQVADEQKIGQVCLGRNWLFFGGIPR